MNFDDILKDHPNLANQDLNQVWKVLSQLHSSNPKKYQQFLGIEFSVLERVGAIYYFDK